MERQPDQHRLRLVVLLVLAMSAMPATAKDVSIELDLDSTHHIEIKALDDGVYEIKTTGVVDGTVANYASQDSRRFDQGR